jgi:hypothetical protein
LLGQRQARQQTAWQAGKEKRSQTATNSHFNLPRGAWLPNAPDRRQLADCRARRNPIQIKTFPGDRDRCDRGLKTVSEVGCFASPWSRNASRFSDPHRCHKTARIVTAFKTLDPVF